jgi:outer membrane protein assembly factor BamB
MWESAGFEAVTRAVHANFEYTLYVGSKDERLIALDEYSGEFLWSVGLDGEVSAEIVCGSGGSVVYAGTDSGFVYAVDGGYDHNILLWKASVAGSVEHLVTQTGGGSGVVYASTGFSLHALVQSTGTDSGVGEELWQYKQEDAHIDALLESINGENLFVVWSKRGDSWLDGINSHGKHQWRSEFKGQRIMRPAKQIDGTDEVLYVAYRHEVQAISSSNGKLQWSLPLDESSTVSNLLVWNLGTMLFATTTSQAIYGIKLSATTGEVLWDWSGSGEELSAPAGGKSSVYVAAGTQLYSIPTFGASATPTSFSFGDAVISFGDDDDYYNDDSIASFDYYNDDSIASYDYYNDDSIASFEEHALEQHTQSAAAIGRAKGVASSFAEPAAAVFAMCAVAFAMVLMVRRRRRRRRSSSSSSRHPASPSLEVSSTMPVVSTVDVVYL